MLENENDFLRGFEAPGSKKQYRIIKSPFSGEVTISSTDINEAVRLVDSMKDFTRTEQLGGWMEGKDRSDMVTKITINKNDLNQAIRILNEKGLRNQSVEYLTDAQGESPQEN